MYNLPADAPTEKTCTMCFEAKPLDEFYNSKGGKHGKTARCKLCTRATNNAYNAAHPGEAYERVKAWRELPGNRERKNKTERNRRKKPRAKKAIKAYDVEYQKRPGVRDAFNARRREARANETPEEREVRLAKRRSQSENTPEKKAAAKARRATRNAKQEVKDKANAARRKRYAENALYRCSLKMRMMLQRTLRKAGNKKTDSTEVMLGYTPDQLRQRIECQFTPGMSWDNKGYRTWHIDHRKPIAAFLAQGITDPRIINALCNLKPMWAAENQEKSFQWPYSPPANDNNKSEVRHVA